MKGSARLTVPERPLYRGYGLLVAQMRYTAGTTVASTFRHGVSLSSVQLQPTKA
jgi:hypothetical protein